jgi:thioesterase domain-containing protein
MAADYLQSVLKIQPSGPYLLGGFCYGGVVALEMARQLQKRGQEVEVVLMIDSQARNLSFRFPRNAVALLATVFHLKPGTEAEIFRRLKLFLLMFQEAHEVGAWRAISFLGSKLKSYLIRGVRLLGPSLSRHTETIDASAPWERSTPWWHSHLAMEAYVPQKYSGRIVLFRSASIKNEAFHDPTAGWGQITSDVAVEWIPGDHRSCVTKHVADLARKMRPHLMGTVPYAVKAPVSHEVRIGQAN